MFPAYLRPGAAPCIYIYYIAGTFSQVTKGVSALATDPLGGPLQKNTSLQMVHTHTRTHTRPAAAGQMMKGK